MLPSSRPAQAARTIVRALAHARKLLLEQVRRVGGEPDARFAAAFVQLAAAIEAAFRHEEALMDAIGFPGVVEQRRDNALLLSALHHAAPRVEAGDLGLGREVVAALPDLLSLHRFCGLRMLATARGSPGAQGPLPGRAIPHRAGRRRRQA